MRVEVVAVALLVALSVGVLLPNHPAGRDPAEDAGVFFYAAQRLLDGGAPYRDIWDHKPPGVYFVDAVGIALAGRTGVWFVQVAFLVAAVLLGYRALRREFRATAAFVGSFAWLAALAGHRRARRRRAAAQADAHRRRRRDRRGHAPPPPP